MNMCLTKGTGRVYKNRNWSKSPFKGEYYKK